MSVRPSKVVAIVFVVLGFLAGTSPVAFCTNVGFEKIQIANGNDPPLTGGVWYPTAAPAAKQALGLFTQDVAPGAQVSGRSLPLVVISHGGGSSYDAHYDTALALAHAGFVAASINHTGDTYDDQSQVLRLWRRPAQLHRLVSYMLDEWSQHDRLDTARVGAFGFSNGGFTVLVAAGGIPDLNKTAPYCRAHPDHDLCQALGRARVDPHLGADISPGVWTHDWRIKAAVVVAPAFGFTFDQPGLKNVHIPIQLWRAANDHHQPDPWYEEAVRLALPHPPDYHVVADAGHYDFLPPCSPRLMALRPAICAHPPHFDRAAFHQVFNAQIVRFFRTTLH
jgi:predicted dienelactone hydrolase